MSLISKRARRGGQALLAAVLLAAGLGSTNTWANTLYVSPSGDNAVSYAANSISSPWKTIEHGLYNLKAGDHLYIRGGSYTPYYPVWLGTDYDRQTKGGDPNEVLNAQTGTATNPVTIENYPGEKVTVDLSHMTAGMGEYINLDNKSYWTFRGLTFINSLIVFVVAENYPTTNDTFDSLTITANRGGDNSAAIHLWSGRADYTTIQNCTITGPGQNVHLNTGTIYLNAVNHVKILNNVLSNAPIGIYFKHRNDATTASAVNDEVAYNYITNTTRSSLEYNGNFTQIHDNVFGANTAPAHFGDANGGAGADYNTVSHNTFLSGSLNFDSAVEAGDPFPGVVGNTVVNNIFQSPLSILQYSSATNTNVMGKNLYPSSNAIVSGVGSLISMIASAIIGKPTYVGGAAPSTIAGFQLAAGSLGKNAATDGTDIGATISKILAGQGGTVAQGPVVPQPPTNVVVQ